MLWQNKTSQGSQDTCSQDMQGRDVGERAKTSHALYADAVPACQQCKLLFCNLGPCCNTKVVLFLPSRAITCEWTSTEQARPTQVIYSFGFPMPYSISTVEMHPLKTADKVSLGLHTGERAAGLSSKGDIILSVQLGSLGSQRCKWLRNYNLYHYTHEDEWMISSSLACFSLEAWLKHERNTEQYWIKKKGRCLFEILYLNPLIQKVLKDHSLVWFCTALGRALRTNVFPYVGNFSTSNVLQTKLTKKQQQQTTPLVF